MTNVYELDGSRMAQKDAAHVYLRETLGFPPHYGMNSDALYDCLTEDNRETILWIGNANAVHPAIYSVFEDAMEENPFLTVIFEEEN